MTKTIVVDDNTYKFQIWDTAGQEKVSDGLNKREDLTCCSANSHYD